MAKWVKEHQWELVKGQQKFLDNLKDNGFTIVKLREWQSKTDYVISKDGVEVEFAFHHVPNSEGQWNFFLTYFNLAKEIKKL